MKTNCKFAFFGTSRFSVFVLDELKQRGFIPKLIITERDKPVGRKKILTPPLVKVWANNNGLPVLQLRTLKKDLPEELTGQNWDIFVVASYGKIIPQNVIDIPQKGILNVHPSLLPLFRGPSPIQSSIMAGVKESGVTIMLIDADIDHGPVLATEKLEIGNWKPNYLELEEKTAKIGGSLLSEIIPDWTSGKIKAKEQDHNKATFTKMIKTEDGLIESKLILEEGNPQEKLEEAERKIRALNPEPGTYTTIGTRKKDEGLRVKILTAKIEGRKLAPSRIIPAGKKEMAWEDFLRGNPI